MATDDVPLRFSFADSEVLRLVVADGILTAHFSAAWVERHAAGAAPLTGYVRGLRMALKGASPSQPLDAMGRLRGGRLLLAPAGGVGLGQLEIPGRWPGPLTLELDFAQGPALRWNATELVCDLQPGWDFQESLAC